MFATLAISFREFLEAFLIIGVFLGISRKLKLKREKEILLAAGIGIFFSLLLPVSVFLLGERANSILTEKNAELLEGYLSIFSGFFLGYVVLSLHSFFRLRRSKHIIKAHQKLQQNIFDVSLFFTIIFFVLREGFEIALFTATTSLFSKFLENVVGLLLGFAASGILGLLTFFAYIKFSIGKVFKFTEYFIILLGGAFVKNGLNELMEVYFNIHLSQIVPVHLGFLPKKSSFVGHFLASLSGLEQNFSVAMFAIIAGYLFLMYFLLGRYQPKVKA